METTQNLKETARSPLTNAWDELQALADSGEPLDPVAYRLAFADPEFMLRREVRGIRFQLELLKPELGLRAAGINQTIVVYGGARFLPPDVAQTRLEAARQSGDAATVMLAERNLRTAHYYQQAREFGQLVARHSRALPPEEKFYICTGGGPGVMEAANRGAHDEGEPSVGLNITLPHEQHTNPYVTPELAFKFHYFALRKMHFMMRAKALVAFPGGYGTLDELFEVLTLVQTGKARPVPIVLIGHRYWHSLLNLELLAEEGAISPEDLRLYHIVDTPEQAWTLIRDFYQSPPETDR